MDRRDFLKSLAALGLVAASPKFIFDLGANKFKDFTINVMTDWEWVCLEPRPEDPFRKTGYFLNRSLNIRSPWMLTEHQQYAQSIISKMTFDVPPYSRSLYGKWT